MRATDRPGSRFARPLAGALAALALAVCGAAFAGGHDGGGHSGGGGGGGGGGGHSGGGGHAGGGHAGGAAPAFHGGGYAGRGAINHYYSGYRGGYRGGSAGYRPRAGYVPGGAPGGYYRGPGYGHGWHGGGGWWYGRYWGGVGLGLYFATLPWYYETIWWGGVPYYYADDTFYRWNDAVSEYESVAPPGDDGAGAAVAPSGELYVYPRQGQTDEQQRHDRYDCHRWAADQTGFDPTRANGGVSPQNASAQAGAYRRAESACLEGRGYTVR